jgi:dipeptidyl aminopeptidase/acylaminoacyl peptidase
MNRLPLTGGAALAAALLLASSLDAQLQPYTRHEGELLPIASHTHMRTQVLKEGTTLDATDGGVVVRPSDRFAEGFVKFDEEQVDLDPLRNASAVERANPSALRFRYRVKLTADRSVGSCYGLLTFVTQGSVGTKLVPIGRLGANSTKPVEIEMVTRVDAIGTLHVFDEVGELRSTKHPEKYDANAYIAGLTQGSAVLSATELLKSEIEYPHVLSADGRLLASLRKRDAHKTMIVYDLSSMKLVLELPVAEADNYVDDLTWVSDHEVAFVAETDYRTRQSDYELRLLDINTSKVATLLDETTGIVRAVASQPEVLVVHQIGRSWGFNRYNVHTRKFVDWEEPDGSGFYRFDREGVSRVYSYVDGDVEKFRCRPTGKGRWLDLDGLVKQPGLRFSYPAAETLNRVADLHSIGPDGDTIYLSTRLGTDRFELAAYSLAEGVIKRSIAKHPRYDLTSGDFGMTRLLFGRKSAALLGIVFEAQKPQVIWFDPAYAAVQKAMDTTFPDHINLPLDWTPDRSTFVYWSSSDRDPGTYYVFKPAESQLIPLLAQGERLQGRTLASTTAIDFLARDGARIAAYVTRPPKTTEGPAPLLVRMHGGPMARDSWGFDATNQFFASRGYVVLQVNYRGSSGYGAAFQKAGLDARLDTVVLDDVADGVRFLLGQGGIDPQRIAIMGASFGGWGTYMSLIKYPEIYRAGVAIAAVSHWRKALQDDRWKLDNQMGYQFWKALLGRHSFKEDEPFIDPYLRAAELKQPVLIIHGEYDDVVHATEAKLMLDALKKKNPNVQSISFPYASHSWWPFEDQVVQLNEAASFLERHLPPAAAPTVATASAR